MPPKRPPGAAAPSTKSSSNSAKTAATRGGKAVSSSTRGPAAVHTCKAAVSGPASSRGAAAGRGGTTGTGVRGRGAGAARGGGAPVRGRGAASSTRGGKATVGTGRGASKAAPTVAASKPAKKAWTKEDDAARILQTNTRRILAQRQLAVLKLKKQQYLDEMQKIEREAWRQIMMKEKKEAEELMQKEAEERRKRKEELNRQKRMLEAAFDGDMEEIVKLFKEVEAVAKEEAKTKSKDSLSGQQLKSYIQSRQMKLADCEDANKNTPLSEAAAGGSTDIIRYLMAYCPDLNSKGAFGRTPLYRAAFAGHLETAKILLELGGDPRIHADDGAKPEQVASQDAVRDLFVNWDLATTETALSNLSLEKEKREKLMSELKEAETKRLTDSVAEAEHEHKRWQKELKKAYQELEKRISEHDKLLAEGRTDMKEVTIQMIQDAEGELEIVKMSAEQAEEALQKARLVVRDQQQEGNPDNLVGIKTILRELDDVLIRDVGNRIKDSGKWPLLIDETRQVATFLRYRDTNFINTMHAQDMEPNSLRMALLGSLRYGKPMVIDMLDADMWDVVQRRFAEVRPGLLAAIMNKTITKESVYEPLIRKEDGTAYEKRNFMAARVQDFRLFVITRRKYPPDELVGQMYPIRVIAQAPPS